MELDLEQELMQTLAKEIADEIDRGVMNNIMWELTLEKCAGWIPVELKWEKGKDTDYFWNEACAWAIENFGLPGDNYVTHPEVDNMLFLFKHQEHAMLMTLRWI